MSLAPRPLLAAATALLLGGCFDEPPPAADTSNLVFDDNLVDADFQAFQGSKLDALSRDTTQAHGGKAALKVAVPSAAAGSFAGGAFVAKTARDLSRFDTLTFWAKASADVTVDVVGLANDNTGTSRYTAQWKNVALSTTWNQYFVPIPLPSRLTAEKGLFFFAAAAPSGGAAFTLWLDDIRFSSLGAGVLGDPRPALAGGLVTHAVGDTFLLPAPTVTWAVNGVDETLEVARATFDFASSDSTVVAVGTDGSAEALAPGTAVISAALGATKAAGHVTVTVAAGLAPSAAAPRPPALAAAQVLSLFSNDFTNQPVDSWRADWSLAGPVTDTQVAGDAVKKYTQLQYAGVEFATHALDVTLMTALHLDVWTPDATTFKVKLVDFGANGAYGGGDDKEHELAFTASSNPTLKTKEWLALELPLSAFTGLTTRAHLAQLVLSASGSIVYVDNVYFHK